ncbi:MAG: glycoside hydrolase family 88 protein [Clostridia bacterium]|nr:glycoside hydrolase family 88 protein [Clostridia bacterium]
MKNASQILNENKAWVEETFAKLDKKLRKVAVRAYDVVADGVDENGRFIDRSKTVLWGWTNGFWGGLNALMYEHTKAPEYLECAKTIEKKMDAALREVYDKLHHDVGFQWHILSGALYRITGDKGSRARNLFAASTLAGRFNIDAGFIRAWNGPKDVNRTIIDTLMNLPLLYWASREVKDDRFAQIAMAHADTALCDHLRDDGSVAHIVEHDGENGAVLSTFGGQGIAEGSSWSRGQSWAVYGLTLSYIHTKEQRYLDGAKLAANYFISNCCDDWLPRIDFRAPAEPVYYDSTAAMVTACGLIELAKILPENEGGMYMNAAINLLRANVEAHANFDENVDFVMDNGSVRYPCDGDLKKAGVHIPIIYGDYYFAEALLKLLGSEFLPW